MCSPTATLSYFRLFIDFEKLELIVEVLTAEGLKECLPKNTLSAALSKLSSPLYNSLSFLSPLISPVLNIYSISFNFSISSFKSLFISSSHSFSISCISRRRGRSFSVLLLSISCVLILRTEFKEFLIFRKYFKSCGRI